MLTVFDGSPARRAGIRVRDVITGVDGESIEGKTAEQATALIKGPAGSTVTLAVVTGRDEPRTLKLRRERVDVPVVESEMRRSGGRRIAHVRLAGFTSGAHGEVRQAIDDLLGKGADGVVLDLRDNGGGLLNEAVLVSSIFIGDGTIVSTKGRTRPRRVFEATGNAIDADVPVVVLVNRESASASEIVAGALQDRGRAEVVGTRTFGKGVFQEVRELSNGGALDITVGEYFTPKGRNLGGGGVKKGAGIEPEVKARDDTATRGRDEALEVGGRDGRARGRAVSARGGAAPVVAVLERRGRFLTAEPFFARGRRINVDRPKPGRHAGPGDLVLIAPNGPRAGHGRVLAADRPPGRRARRARGADARPRAAPALRPAGRARGARRGGERGAGRAAQGPARPADVHDRSADRARLRRRDQRRAARRAAWCACGSTSPTSPRTCRPARRSTVRRTGARRASTSRARSSRCCPRRSPTTPARSCPTRTASPSPSSSTSTAPTSCAPPSTAR